MPRAKSATGAATTAAPTPAAVLAAVDPITEALSQPLDPRRVSTRRGSGSQQLSYLQAHDVKRTANRIFGYGGWSYSVESLDVISEEPVERNGRKGFRVGYRATVTASVVIDNYRNIQRGDVGYGDAVEYTGSRITPHELAAKEAVSDALKRCLASFGDQFGLCLYGDDPAPAEPEPEPAPAAPASPVPMAPARLFKEMGEKLIAAGFDRDDVLAACKAEKDAHGGYRMAWVVDWTEKAEKALKSAEGEA